MENCYDLCDDIQPFAVANNDKHTVVQNILYDRSICEYTKPKMEQINDFQHSIISKLQLAKQADGKIHSIHINMMKQLLLDNEERETSKVTKLSRKAVRKKYFCRIKLNTLIYQLKLN